MTAEAPGYDWPRLRAELQGLPGAIVAFSGGVDSAALLFACREALGRERVLAVIADSPSLARAELDEARRVAAQVGVELRELGTDELHDERYRANSGDRCFWCKEALFEQTAPLAGQLGWPVLYGENADDSGDHRPGAASAARRGVRAPLRDAGWSKAMVRAYARAAGLSVADKPAMPCLASRLPVGVAVSAAALAQVEGLEAAIRARGFRIVRARHLSAESVRLEFGAGELSRAQAMAKELAGLARAAGYREAVIDPAGYRRGAVARA